MKTSNIFKIKRKIRLFTDFIQLTVLVCVQWFSLKTFQFSLYYYHSVCLANNGPLSKNGFGYSQYVNKKTYKNSKLLFFNGEAVLTFVFKERYV